jgi:3-phosphoshikimate 1-carboxyvinyltransferase
MMQMTVKKSKGLRGEIRMPGDKSITHRAIILGSIAKGTSRVRGFLPADDCLRTAETFRRMGIPIEADGRVMTLHGRGLRGLNEPADVLDLGNSGTSLRLLTGLLSGQRFFSVLTGDDSLRRRPMRRVTDPLQKMGAVIHGRIVDSELYAPVAILGRPLKGINYTLPIASAQVKSALLLAGLLAEGPTTLKEPIATRDHTERMLRIFGVDLSIRETTVALKPPRQLEPCEVQVPGDLSSAAFLIVAALIVPDSELILRDVGVNPTRMGAIELLRQMGGAIRIENTRQINGEPLADLVVRSSALKGMTIGAEWVPRTIDEFPVLAVAAALAEGETVIRGAGELRVKESDRLATIARELSTLGVRIEERPDGLIIRGGRPLRGATVKSHGDHRIAMALAVAGLAATGETVITDTACIGTSFPGFEMKLKKVMVQGRPHRAAPATTRRNLIIAIDGPAGSGKSSAARLLAKKLGYLYVDTGALYRAVGWKALKERVDLKDESALGRLAERLEIGVSPSPDRLHVWVEGVDITDRLRTPEVSQAAAAVAVLPRVRKRLFAIQRAIGRNGGVVMEGRDIGTVVFPEADLKFFLTASMETRVKRRFKELKQQGTEVNLAKTQQELDVRDLKDSRRRIAPLKQADDAIPIDSTHLSLNDVVNRMWNEVKKKM